MNKKVNTVLFLLGATVFNLLVIVIVGLILLKLVSMIFGTIENSAVGIFLLMVVFVGSIAASFFIYGRVVKWLQRRIDMEKYFMPLFRRKR